RRPMDVQRFRSRDEIDGATLDDLSKLATALFTESNRAFLGSKNINFAGLLDCNVAALNAGSCCLVAYASRQAVGFLTGQVQTIPLIHLVVLQSSYLYVLPEWRGSHIARQLLDSFALTADELGASASLLGTSSSINTDRVCKYLDIRGYRHAGDVFSYRIDPAPGART